MAKKDNNNKKHFFKDFKAELRKVIWPTPKQVVNNTIAVIVIVLITAAIVFVLDLCFDLLNTKGVNKLKASIRNTTVIETTVEDENNAEEASNAEEGNNAEGEITPENAE